ncbi:MAG: hypothetical protein ACHQ4J_04300 [Candidatus Binatia bacterium]
MALAVLAAGVAVVGAVSPATAAKAPAQGRKASIKPPKRSLADSFQTFCKEWMAKVHARDTPIDWQTDPDGVRGTYVEYSPEYTCTLTKEKPPVGTIGYREMWYEKRGRTMADAEHSTPQPVKAFDTSEIFSRIRGTWSQ